MGRPIGWISLPSALCMIQSGRLRRTQVLEKTASRQPSQAYRSERACHNDSVGLTPSICLVASPHWPVPKMADCDRARHSAFASDGADASREAIATAGRLVFSQVEDGADAPVPRQPAAAPVSDTSAAAAMTPRASRRIPGSARMRWRSCPRRAG